MQFVDTGAVDGNFILLRKAEVAGNRFGIVGGHLAIYQLSAERYLDSIESELGRQRHRIWIGAQLQVPIRHTNTQFLLFGEGDLRRHSSSNGGTEKSTSSNFAHWKPPYELISIRGRSRGLMRITKHSES